MPSENLDKGLEPDTSEAESSKSNTTANDDGFTINWGSNYDIIYVAIAESASKSSALLELTNDKAYDAADNSEVSTIDKVFKAGDRLSVKVMSSLLIPLRLARRFIRVTVERKVLIPVLIIL